VAILETPRLRLRMFRQTDADAYTNMVADTEVARYLSGQPLSPSEAWRHMAMLLGHWQLFGFGPWAVEERASGELVGRIGLYYPAGWPDLELIWTIRRQSWGHGYATEGARAALTYVFKQMGRDRVISLIRAQNTASIRVAEKLGQRLQDRMDFYGEEALVYGIRRDEWLDRRL
jgi:RimJ/RimL family protein N-acetyltransferase